MSKRYLFFFFVLMLLLFARFFQVATSFKPYKNGEVATFKTSINSEPKQVGKLTTFTANLPNGQKVFTRTIAETSLEYGDTVAISGPVKTKDSANLSTGVLQVLQTAREPIFIDFPKISKVENDNIFVRMSNSIRGKIISNFEETLPPSSSGLLLGIVFGIKTYMPAEFYDSLKVAGVLHIVAASGMNVTMVAGFLASLFGRLFKRQYALIVCILGIWAYAFFAGFEASIVRAAIMSTAAFSAAIIGRQYSGLYFLFIAAFVMLFVSPFLVLDIGWQLSFLATLGIVEIGQAMSSIKLLKIPFVAEDLRVTVAAQVFTLPILLSNFGTYSPFSILANLLVLWTIPFLMILGGIAAFFSLILAPVGKIFLFLSLPILFYFEKVVGRFGELPQLGIEHVPWQFGAAYLFVVLSAIVFIRIKNQNER